MNVVRVYIKPFDENGQYQPDWIDVTNDIDGSIGSINADLDNTDYDIGVYRNSNFQLTLRNSHGKYSDVGSAQSIFNYTRSNSLVKVTWDISEFGAVCGLAVCGEAILSEEVEIFKGLLNDESSAMTLSEQKISFAVLGRESLFQKNIVPFGTVHDGDLFSVVLYSILNQQAITTHLTVSQVNITCGIDLPIDSIASLQNKTVQEGLNKLLLASNSVLYIEDDAVKISPRSPSSDLKFSFYGQASSLGSENVTDIENIKNGFSKIFNYFVWKATDTVAADNSSITKFGVRKKEVDFEFVTDTDKRRAILEALLAEFKDPKQEFHLVAPIWFDVLKVGLLGKVNIDYPTTYMPGAEPLPICGVAICGEAFLPVAQWSFILEPEIFYKTIGKSVDPSNGRVKFRLRAI